MKSLFALVALPVYAVAIGVQCCAVAFKLARAEWRLQRDAKAAVERYSWDLCAECEQEERGSDENEWGIN